MTSQEAIAALRALPEISELNPMQLATAGAQGRKLLLLAPTGSGKTLAFALPILQTLSPRREGLQAVVVAPSRELVLQTTEVLRRVARGFKVTHLYGGHPFRTEEQALAVTPAVIVATPGRLTDHLQRRTLSVADTRILVLDEYDKMLELGFEKQMRALTRPMTRLDRMVLTSATAMDSLPDWLPIKGSAEVLNFTPHAIGNAVSVPVIEVPVPTADKLDTLTALLRALPQGKVIVFVNHRESAQRVHDRLLREHLPAGIYHGALDQNLREDAVAMFETAVTPILVSTDLGSRGLDIEGVDAVIHYHIPITEVVWTHRNGRTNRQGRGGEVYLLRSEQDSLPDYITTDRTYSPGVPNPDGIRSDRGMLHLNRGRKEKLSRGDIVGFLIAQGGLTADDIGRILLRDHDALVPVPKDRIHDLVKRLNAVPLKGKRVRVQSKR